MRRRPIRTRLGWLRFTICRLVPRVADVMALIAGKAIGHLDLKDAGGEERVVEMALDLLGPGRFVVTTLEDESVAAVKARFPEVPAALSLGRDLAEVPRSRWAATRYGELRPLRRLRACRADWVAVNHRPADAVALHASLSPASA